MTLATRGMGSPNLIPTSGLGDYSAEDSSDDGASGGIIKQKRFKLFSVMGDITRDDISARRYEVDAEADKQVTAKQVVEMLDKGAVSALVKEVKRELGILAPEARLLIEARALKQIEAMRLKRIEEINEQALIMIMAAIASDL